ncbi:MAG: LamG domain-containing protein [Methanomicrobiales archaeon]|nr:LamG domain-containing protein [Methanomicrobiales archaeon]
MESEFEAAVRDNAYFLWGYGYRNDWERIASPLTGTWNYYAITYDGNKARWYLNGTQIGSGFEFDYDTADSHVFIGYESDSGQSSVTYMNGMVDEVRVASKARSSSWIQTEYNNQNSPSTFYSVDYEMDQPQSCAPTPVPTATPTPVPTTVEPTETPTPVPTTAEPTETPTPVPTTAEPTETPTPVPTTAEPTPTPTPAFSCPTGTYSLVTAEGETSGCVAVSNDWAYNATSNLEYNTLFVTFTAADSTCLTGAKLAVSLDMQSVDPQFQQVFDPAACTTSYTFSIELPSNFDDITCLYISATGTVQKVTDGVSSADMEVSALNPIEYLLLL